MARRMTIAAVLVMAMLALAACGGIDTATDTPTTDGLPGVGVLDGATLLSERCVTCHTLDRVRAAKKPFDQWVATIDRMIGKGAQLTPEERTVLADYLSKQ